MNAGRGRRVATRGDPRDVQASGRRGSRPRVDPARGLRSCRVAGPIGRAEPVAVPPGRDLPLARDWSEVGRAVPGGNDGREIEATLMARRLRSTVQAETAAAGSSKRQATGISGR